MERSVSMPSSYRSQAAAEAGEAMGASLSDVQNQSPHQVEEEEDPTVQQQPHEMEPNKKVSLVPLNFLIFFEVSGGPFGEEPAVGAAGPLLAILGFSIFPFVWSIPEALITAELATTFPGNGGYVLWTNRAFGPFWASLMGNLKFLSGAINNAAYPVLCADYLKAVLPIFSGGTWRNLAIFFFNLVLTFLNYTGLTIVGYAAVALGVASLLPFLLMFFISIPRIRPRRWVDLGRKRSKKQWNTFFNTLFWNLNYWDNASTLAGEVDRPQETFPKALLAAGVLTCLGYLIPLLSGIGALDVEQSEWSEGFLAEAAGMIGGGDWLKYWVEVGSVLSVLGLFEAQLSSGSFQLLGQAELGFIPGCFKARSEWFGTPWAGIIAHSGVTLAVSFLSFGDIISAANLLYSLGMLLEFAAFIWLRRKYPSLKRPYRVPLPLPGVVIMCLVPAGFLVFVMAIANRVVFIIGGGLTAASGLSYFLMRWCRAHGCLKFCEAKELEGADGSDTNAVERGVLSNFDPVRSPDRPLN